ncbi:MAG: response regulator [Lachnospiraceae bacterium]|nr:response regulator [Lachnospiraceae bacterium]
MNFENVLNIISLLTRIIGLLSCLFLFIDRPRKGWLYMASFYLLFLLSDYYWTVYTLVMGENPDVAAFLAYFGWNMGYLILWITAYRFHSPEEKKFFHPAMLIPIPLNIMQLLLYNTFGGYFNNFWQVITTTGLAIECLRSLIYYLKNRKESRPPHFYICCFLFVICEYGMWTSSCFDWPSEALYPYNYFAVLSCFLVLSMARTMEMSYGDRHNISYEKTSAELRDQLVLQVVFCVIVLGSCLGGYILAVWIRTKLVMSGVGNNDEGVFSIIAITLFVVSVFLALLVISFMTMVAMRQRKLDKQPKEKTIGTRGRFNFVFILLITFLLMIFAVIYTSSLFYRVSVSGSYETCEDKADSAAAQMENYINESSSVLWVIANTVDGMMASGASQQEICDYIVTQTENQKSQFDENFTGVYGYVRGEYMDGLNWVPPEGYDARERDWYKYAIDSDGSVVIVPPYVDAQTNTVVVTFCKKLSDGEAVVALDVIVNHIQKITEEINVNGKGYGLVVDSDGIIIAHNDKKYVGTNCSEAYGRGFLDDVKASSEDTGGLTLSDGEHIIFTKTVLGQWYMVIVITNSELQSDIRSQLFVNIVVFLLLFVLMTLFYYLGYKNEQAYGKKMEELSVNRQKQDYETRMLKLEKKAADEANRAKSSFLADMSHEIRTPINAMLGMNEMIMRESTEPEIRKYSSDIKAAGGNLLMLINSILDFSKIEDGKMEIGPVNYSTESMITYLVNSISQRAKDKGLEFRTVIDPKLPSALYGDDMRIEQVVMNLLTNAVKYTPEGSVTLTVKAAGYKADELLMFVQVSDTGIGIKKEDMPHLFETFERLDIRKNRNIEGTGLGMSIVTKLLELMDSSIQVESVYGSGSVFSFEIYQKIVDASPIGDISNRVSKYAAGENAGTYKESFHAPDARILVVDDIKLNLTVITSLLKRTELIIDTTMSGEEALILTGEKEYDLIFLDQRMPGLDGIQTLMRIRSQKNGRNIHTPVICLTADAVSGAKEKYIASGFSDYLIKPIDTYELERMLFRFLPEEKIQVYKEPAGIVEDEKNIKDPVHDDSFSILEKGGLEVKHALMLLQNDPEIYRAVLGEFAAEYTEKHRKLNEYYEAREWESYAILAHSLKSTSHNIGAQGLSGLAAEMEIAADDEDEAFILDRHNLMMKLYTSVVNLVNNQLGERGYSSSADATQEVFEFAPEE